MPLIIPLRLLNTVMLVVAAVVFLLECRQLIRAPGVLSLILVVLAVVVAIRAFKLLQTREGVAVIGATREYYNRLQGAILSSNPDYAQYRSQRGNVLVREAYKHPRTSGPAASVLLADMRRYRSSHRMQLPMQNLGYLITWVLTFVVVLLLLLWLLR